jgi:hypothetical protein
MNKKKKKKKKRETEGVEAVCLGRAHLTIPTREQMNAAAADQMLLQLPQATSPTDAGRGREPSGVLRSTCLGTHTHLQEDDLS